jgi:hypothetical protein
MSRWLSGVKAARLEIEENKRKRNRLRVLWGPRKKKARCIKTQNGRLETRNNDTIHTINKAAIKHSTECTMTTLLFKSLLFSALLCLGNATSGSIDDFHSTVDDGDHYAYGEIRSDDSPTSACIEVKKNVARRGQKLILGDCSTAKGDGWRGDSDGLLHSELNDEYCIQAGHGGKAKSGKFLRLYKCDASNKLQQWVFINGGGIRLKHNQNLCIVWRGVHANIGQDPLILKSCDDVEDRNDWSNDPFPASHDDDRSPCVDPSVPEFMIDDDVDIGDTMMRPGPAFAAKCGPDCYTVKDNGDDPPYDPELGDTLRFAYKEVTSNNFFMRSRVCGISCDGQSDAGMRLDFGRTGLMVRDSLDPLARNVFVSHSPDGQADWSYRTVFGGESIVNMDGSPDVPCLWISLTRDGNEFSASYAYEGSAGQCDREEIEFPQLSFTIEMLETVYVGLAVSSGLSPPHCTYTEADFNDIECRGC